MKTEITENQKAQFNRMRSALLIISREYKSTDQLRRESEKQYGLEYEEALEMAFENIQGEAEFAVKGVKAL